jgi:hypothetical protein
MPLFLNPIRSHGFVKREFCRWTLKAAAKKMSGAKTPLIPVMERSD